MRRRTLLAAVVALAGTAGLAHAQDAVRIGTSSVGSAFYTLSVGIGEMMNRHGGINATVEPLGGSGPNIFGLADGTIELAMVNSFTAMTGYRGEAPFSDPTELYLLFQGQPTYRFILVRPDAGIETPRDLVGRTFVGGRRAMPEIEQVAEAMFRAYGIDPSTVNIVGTQNTNEALEAASVGSVDGVIIPGGRLDPALMEAVTNGRLKFLSLEDEYFERMAAALPDAFYTDQLNPGDYPGVDQPIRIVGMNTYVIARPGVDEDLGYRITKAVLENTAELAAFHSGGAYYTLERALIAPAVPFHPGTIRFLQEAGVWTDELEALNTALTR